MHCLPPGLILAHLSSQLHWRPRGHLCQCHWGQDIDCLVRDRLHCVAEGLQRLARAILLHAPAACPSSLPGSHCLAPSSVPAAPRGRTATRWGHLSASPAQPASTATQRGAGPARWASQPLLDCQLCGACYALPEPAALLSPSLKRLHSAAPCLPPACRPAPPVPTLVAAPPAASSAAPGFTPPLAAACAAPGERGAWSAAAVMRCLYCPCKVVRMQPCFVQASITLTHPHSPLLPLTSLLQQSGHICFWLPNRQLRCMPQGVPVPHHSHQVSGAVLLAARN